MFLYNKKNNDLKNKKGIKINKNRKSTKAQTLYLSSKRNQ
jgi:hypothetical protein